MIIDVTEIGEDEAENEPKKAINEEAAKKDISPQKPSKFERKTLLVGLVIALLFIGGGVYAWQNSQLKGSIGQAVQMVDIDTKEESQDQFVQLIGEIEMPTVQRSTNDIVRTRQQSVQVIAPNGGETFCLGDTFDILWSSRGIEMVHVLLQRKEEVYNFGHVPAYDSVLQERITVPREGNTYKVVVAAVNQIEVQDTSDAFFAIQDCTE